MIDTAGPLALCDRVAGCLLGGATGDALGAAVEFLSHEEILRAPDRTGRERSHQQECEAIGS